MEMCDSVVFSVVQMVMKRERVGWVYVSLG